MIPIMLYERLRDAERIVFVTLILKKCTLKKMYVSRLNSEDSSGSMNMPTVVAPVEEVASEDVGLDGLSWGSVNVSHARL